MKADQREAAWELVRAYMAAHMDEVPESKRAKVTSFNESTIAPLGALVAFELARRKLSYTRAAIEINRKLPESMRDSPSLAPSTLFYFKNPKRAYWSAMPETLEQLALGFDWDLVWLHAVNGDPILSQTTTLADVPEIVRRVAEIMLGMQPDLQLTVLHYVSNFAGHARIEERRPAINHAS